MCSTIVCAYTNKWVYRVIENFLFSLSLVLDDHQPNCTCKTMNCTYKPHSQAPYSFCCLQYEELGWGPGDKTQNPSKNEGLLRR